MEKNLLFSVTLTFCLFFQQHALAQGPLPVSPSSENGVAKVSGTCPTFSWAQEEGAVAYTLEVYSVEGDEVPVRQEAFTMSQPVISKTIPAPALSWTPTIDQCLEAGKRYVWFVEAEYKDGAREWSEGKVFEINGLPAATVEMLREEVKKYAESGGLDYWISGTAPSPGPSLEKEAGARAGSLKDKGAGTISPAPEPGLSLLAYEGTGNVFYGQHAGENTSGDYEKCTFIGAYAGYNNTDGSGFYNTFLGYNSGYSNTSADYNTYLGYFAGYYATGFHNTLVGARAGRGQSSSTKFTGSDNVFVGHYSGHDTTTGHENVFIGNYSGQNNENGDYGVFIGKEAGYSNSSGDDNIFIGYRSGNSTTTGGYNTFVGSRTGLGNTTGHRNVFLGYRTGQENTSGHHNAFLGYIAGTKNMTGYHNTFVGTYAGYNNTAGNYNTFVGSYAGHQNTTGDYNVFLGPYAGYNETGSYKLYIDSTGTSSPLIYGNFALNTLTVHGKLGIGTKTPQADLDLNGGTLTANGTDTSAGGSRLPKLAQIETGRMDMGWGGAGGGNLEFYSRGHSTRPGQFRFVYGGGDFGQIQFIHYDGTNWTNYMTLTKNGYLNMLPDGSTVRAFCDGYTWHDSSSRRFKKDIRQLDAKEAFSAFMALEPVTYKYKGTEELRVGFIAEDVPELVATKDRKSLVAMDIVAVLTKVVQEQQKALTEKDSRIRRLEERISALEERENRQAALSRRLRRLERLLMIQDRLALNVK